MAKKKAGRPKSVERQKPVSFSIRGNAEWKAWLQAYATFRRKEMTEVVDEALEMLAERDGYQKPPKR